MKKDRDKKSLKITRPCRVCGEIPNAVKYEISRDAIKWCIGCTHCGASLLEMPSVCKSETDLMHSSLESMVSIYNGGNQDEES